MGAKFSIASGVDIREGFEVLYHFTFDKHGFICTIRVLAPRDDPKLAPLLYRRKISSGAYPVLPPY